MKDKRRGHCVICGSRVFSDEEYVESAQGYCHVNCLTESSILEQDQVAEKPA